MAKLLKDYQIKAVEEIKELFNIYISKQNKEIVFKAPTGSGKTFIITKFLEQIYEENVDKNICFIWVSIGKGDLHRQSYYSVKNELKGYPDCQLLSPSFISSNSFIDNKQVLFVNWEKLVSKNKGDGLWKNSLMREQEGRNFIDLIEKTKKEGIKIVLIVDESHIGKSSDTSISQFRDNIIQPTITIEMSATPNNNHIDVEVLLEDAIEEGMIKEHLIINKDISLNSIDGENDTDSMALILTNAENRRIKIIEEFTKINRKINPLVLVQVPNTELGDDAISVVEDFLRNINITQENGQLAIWLDGNKEFDSEKIKKNNNEISYLIFKTVIDTGWDCPRAHILVKFRDVHSNVSKIQTIGRILRTPEATKYNNSILDDGYIFTNMEYIDPRNEEYSSNRTKDIVVTIKPNLDKSIGDIESFFKSRVSSYNSADSRIYDIIENEFCKFFEIKEEDIWNSDDLEKKGVITVGLDRSSIMFEMETEVNQWQKDTRIGGGSFNKDVISSEVEIRGKYEEIISQNLNGLARVRSLSPIKQGFSKTIMNHINGVIKSISLSYSQLLIVRNSGIFSKIISNSTNEFKNKYPDANMDGVYSKFEISEEASYSSETYIELKSNLSLYTKMYVIKQGTSILEEKFLQELDLHYSEYIEWVWHNGSEPNVVNFGVMIEKASPSFRPDFIIKFKNGNIGIFDTKGIDYLVEDTTNKANALYKYIQQMKANNNKIFGGIVIQHNNDFLINVSENYHDYEKSSANWEPIRNYFVTLHMINTFKK